MGVLDDPFGFGDDSGLAIGIGDPISPLQRPPDQRQQVKRRFAVIFIQNGLRRTRQFKSFTAAERFRINAKNIDGVTQVSSVFQV